jgi:hypothetical protein
MQVRCGGVFEDHGGVGIDEDGTGQGARIESFYRAVPGGSEDVLIDLGVREAMKLYWQAERGKAKL